MKIIITEEQFNQLQERDRDFNKTKNLVNSMYDEDKLSIDEIVTYTGLDKGAVIVLLYDREVIQDESGECQDKFQYLYYTLFRGDSGLINKDRYFEDGSSVEIVFERFSGIIDFKYTSEGYKLIGYATLMWDAEPKLPVDITTFYDIDGTDYDVDGIEYSSVDLRTDDKFNNIKTFRQLVDYFNNDYYIMLKEELDPLLKRCIKNYL
jgi:hypothetical protein